MFAVQGEPGRFIAHRLPRLTSMAGCRRLFRPTNHLKQCLSHHVTSLIDANAKDGPLFFQDGKPRPRSTLRPGSDFTCDGTPGSTQGLRQGIALSGRAPGAMKSSESRSDPWVMGKGDSIAANSAVRVIGWRDTQAGTQR